MHYISVLVQVHKYSKNAHTHEISIGFSMIAVIDARLCSVT
jgi:uncharacterized protein with PQ loop repeat